VHPLVIPTNNPMYAIATAARDLAAKEVVMGCSEKTSPEVQLEQFAMAWGMAAAEVKSVRPLSVRIIGPNVELKYDVE
jgi:hypothetical protein